MKGGAVFGPTTGWGPDPFAADTTGTGAIGSNILIPDSNGQVFNGLLDPGTHLRNMPILKVMDNQKRYMVSPKPWESRARDGCDENTYLKIVYHFETMYVDKVKEVVRPGCTFPRDWCKDTQAYEFPITDVVDLWKKAVDSADTGLFDTPAK